ncbi:MAG: hypothetical protein ACLQDV_00565 [Candidatus Binataceae bacterium]
MAFLLPPGKQTHPSTKPALLGMAFVGLAIFHPTTNSVAAGLAQFAINIAIMAPLLWVSHLTLDKAEVRRVLFIILAFQATSSLIGVLQIYYPGEFRGSLSSVIGSQGASYLRGLSYKNAAGSMVMRPSGLTDTPGGVGMAGQYATLLSLYFFLTETSPLIRGAAVLAAIVGVAAVYLSGVKAAMILLAIGLAVFVALFFWRSQNTRGARLGSWVTRARTSAIQVLAITAVVAGVGYFLAFNIGGEGVTGATSALTAQAPGTVFYQERGQFLEETITTLLPRYPFGAGLGRWGMMSYYFGNPNNPDSPGIWAEIQWTGWLLDGGVPLVLAYGAAILIALRFAVKCAISPALGDLAVFGALVAAFDVGLIAGTFDYIPFITGMGMDFWVLNAMLFGAIVYASREAGRKGSRGNEAFSAGYR